jgi:hypothetical protein
MVAVVHAAARPKVEIYAAALVARATGEKLLTPHVEVKYQILQAQTAAHRDAAHQIQDGKAARSVQLIISFISQPNLDRTRYL